MELTLTIKSFEGRAFDGGFVSLHPRKHCTVYATRIASFASGKYTRVAKKQMFTGTASYVHRKSHAL